MAEKQGNINRLLARNYSAVEKFNFFSPGKFQENAKVELLLVEKCAAPLESEELLSNND